MLKALLLITPVLLSFVQYAPEPKLSNSPLSADQIEVYRAFLQSYVKGQDSLLRVSNVTVPLEHSGGELKEGKGCLRTLQLENFKEANSTVHLLDALAGSPNIMIVDLNKKGEPVEKNNPDTAGKIEASASRGVARGYLQLSEIAFDRQHHRAVLSYGYHCGRLCGQGKTIILEKVEGTWKFVPHHVCSSWRA